VFGTCSFRVTPMNRRNFLTQSVAGAAFLSSAQFATAQNVIPNALPPAPGSEPKRPSPLEPKLVNEFVRAAHSDLAKVKSMLADTPGLIHASWDWGNGDFETALGGAAHMGNRAVALHLLEAGARIDAFAAAMLGEMEIVAALVRLSPAVANSRGPHMLSLLHHAAHCGRIDLAEVIASHLASRGRDCNQALLVASQRGHVALVEWLLAHGVDNVNIRNFARRTPLDFALEQKHGELIRILRAAGGLSTL
jgi:hypothetical protein